MSVIYLDDYRKLIAGESISADELRTCIQFLQDEAAKAGFSEISDILAIANVATDEIK